jgi:DNA-binding transcriptional LysR family regulator
MTLSILGPMLTVLADRHPGLEVHTREALPEFFPDRVQRGALDAAFLIDYPHSQIAIPVGLGDVLLLTERFSAVVPADHALAEGPVTLADLASEPLIGPPPEVQCGQCVVAAFANAGQRPHIRHQIDDYPSSIRLVAQGHGVSLVPRLALVDLPDGVKVVEVAEPVEREVRLIHRSASAQRPSLEAFIDVARQVVAGLDRPA